MNDLNLDIEWLKFLYFSQELSAWVILILVAHTVLNKNKIYLYQAHLPEKFCDIHFYLLDNTVKMFEKIVYPVFVSLPSNLTFS